MKKLLLIVPIIILSILSCSKKNDEVSEVGIVGRWSLIYEGNDLLSNTFVKYDGDNNYFKSSDRSFKSIIEKGKYSFVNNVLKEKMEIKNEFGEISYTSEISFNLEFLNSNEIKYIFPDSDREGPKVYLKRIN